MRDAYVYGRNPVLESLKHKGHVDKIYIEAGDNQGSIRQIVSVARDQGIVVSRADRKDLEKMAGSPNHQGVVAHITDFEYSTIDEILDYASSKDEDPFVVILDQIEDTHNLGAIIRTAEAAGVHGIIIPKRRAAQINETVYKTSAGAVAHMKVARVTNISRTLDELKDKGLWIYGAHMEGEGIYTDTRMQGSIGVVIGGENKGITDHIANHCDVLVRIPMAGNVSSLNASVSAALMIYEVIRQKNSN